jgi:ankyrin repeat protein
MACSHKYEHSWFVEYGLHEGMEYANQSALVARLIKAGADPNQMSLEGKPLITTAASLADMTVALEALLESGADPNFKDKDSGGFTALSIAVGTVMHTLVDPALDPALYV